MAVRILLGGVDAGDKRLATSDLSWQDQLDGRGTLSVTFRDRSDSGWRPQDGQELLVVEDTSFELATSDDAPILTVDDAPLATGAERLFGGNLLEPNEWEEVGSDGEDDGAAVGPFLFFECQAVEFSAICDRRIVTAIYEQQSLEQIVLDIVEHFLDGEGLTTSGVEAGPTIEKAIFPDVTVTQAFNDLAELTGYSWRIDQYKVLHFRSRTSIAAPAALDGDTLLAGTVHVTRSKEKYRNTQIVRAGSDLTDPRTETRVGDGVSKAFVTAFPLGGVPTVEESRGGGAWTAKAVGILGVESGKDWYWNLGQAQISQDDGGTVLAAPTNPANPATGDRMRITYRGSFPVKTQYADALEIAARRAIEGGSGIYAAVEDRPEIDSAQSALDVAIALLARYGQIPVIVEGVSRVAAFAPGQIASVSFPRHGLENVEMLIDQVSAKYDDDLGEVWYTVHALSGDPWGGWQNYFRQLQRRGRATVIGREGEILVITRLSAVGATCGDAVAVETAAPESRVGIALVGIGEVAA
jgi:hypothetical protein